MLARYHTSPRSLGGWLVLLAFAQMADVLTTGADMSRGGVEANAIVVGLLAAGGLGLVALAKLLLVAGMAVVAALVHEHSLRNPSRTSLMLHTVLWRSVQLSALVLVLVAVHNTVLLAQIA